MIKLQNISKTYSRNGKQTEALKDVYLQVDKGDIYGVIGLSGAGKSTLIRVVNFLEKPTNGNVYIEGNELNACSIKELRNVRKNIGMIFQHFNLLDSKTNFQNIAIPLVLAKIGKREIEERVTELLHFVGLEDKANSYPNELSGGQKQRIGIARALALNPSVLLCDEATSALDPQTTDSVLKLLQKINEEYNITIMMITHDMGIIKKVCNRVAVMEAGQVIEEGDVLEVFGNPQQASTKNLVRTVIQNEIPQSFFEKIEHIPGSKLFKISFKDESSYGLVTDLIRTYNMEVNIVYATMDEIKNNTVGYLVIQLVGETINIRAAADYIAKQTFAAEELSYHV